MKKHPNLSLSLFVIIILLSECAVAQFDYNAILPPSPTASALAEYGNVPISYYTGTPNISIPLASVNGSELSLGISLSYMAKGVKVGEHASWVGTGWVLNCNGVITRTVRGLEDGKKPRTSFPLPTDEEDLKTELTVIEEGNADPEPDLFYFNYPGGSGSFVLDENGEAVLDEVKDIKIKQDATNSYKFTITSENGTQYIFDKTEITTYNTAWTGNASIYLTKIISPTGKETIDFNYESEKTRYFSLGMPVKRIRPGNIVKYPVAPGYGEVVIEGQRLTSIVTNFGSKVTFVPESVARQDLANDGPSLAPKALKEVILTNQFDEAKKIFAFEYEMIETSVPYATSNTGYDPLHDERTTYANYRLYLKSVTEISSDRMLTNPPYEFTYTGRTSGGKDLLPNKLSPAQDHWGYFNNAMSNSTLWPGYSGPFGLYDHAFEGLHVTCPAPVMHVSQSSFSVPGANREPNFPYCGYGTIRSIKYPTGGMTVYEFGSQKYLFESTTSTPVTQKVQVVSQVNVSAQSSETEDIETDAVQYVDGRFAFEFAVSCRDSFTHEPKECGEEGAVINVDKYSGNKVALYDEEGSEVIAVKWDPGVGFRIYKNEFLDPSYSVLQPSAGGYIEGDFPSLEFYSGIYTLKAIKDPDADRDVQGWFYFDKMVPVPLTDTYAKFAGGLRINKIRNLDEHGASVAEKTYEYGFGVLEAPTYSTYVYDGGGLLQRCPTPADQLIDGYPYLEVNSGSHTQLGYTQGASVGYQSVTEKQTGNGSVTYEYTTAIDYPDNNFESNAPKMTYLFWDWQGNQTTTVDFFSGRPSWPFISANNFDRKRGFLKRITYQNEEGQSLKIIENTPLINDIDYVYGVRVQVLRSEIDWLYSTYKFSSGIVNTDLTDETTIIQSPYQELYKETKYFYEGTNHHFLSKRVTQDSDGSELVAEYRYPDDYVSIVDPDHVITQMKKENLHMIGSPVETRTYRNGVRTGGTVNIAGKFSNGSSGFFVAPKGSYRMRNIESSTGPSWSVDPAAPDSEEFYQEAAFTFDESANLVQVVPHDQVKKIYLWEAGIPHPVGEVVNAEQGTSFYASFEVTGTEQISSAPAKTGFRYLNSGSYNFSTAGFSPANPSTLKMSYWYWNGTGWVFSGEMAFSNSISSPGSRLDDIRVFSPGARMTTYTYDTAYGITSVTDWNNISRHYTYDTFGRVTIVKDNDGNIINNFTYHYRTEE